MAAARTSRAAFRVQHIARKPRGWRVRTKHEGRHEIRVAFPPGPRQTGAGKLLEILHPKGEKNPECRVNPAELVIFGNPARRKYEWRGYVTFKSGVERFSEVQSNKDDAMRTAARMIDEHPDWKPEIRTYGAAKFQPEANPKPVIFGLRKGSYSDTLDEWRFTADGQDQSFTAAKRTPKATVRKMAVTEAEARRRLVPRLHHLIDKNPLHDSTSLSAVMREAKKQARKSRQIVYVARQHGSPVWEFRFGAPYSSLRDADRYTDERAVHPNPRRNRRELTVPEKHQVKIAKDTLRMPDPMVGVMGGMTKEQARELLTRLGVPFKENPRRFAGWKHFSKSEKNFIRRMHLKAPANDEEVRAMKEMLAKFDALNLKYKGNPDSPTGALIRSFGLTRDPYAGSGTIYDAIRHGSRVTIVNRFGQRQIGRAVMLGPGGWVLNLGGRYGTPGIATPENTVSVKRGNPSGDANNLVYLAHRWQKSAPDCAAMLVAHMTQRERQALKELNERTGNPSLVLRNAKAKLTPAENKAWEFAFQYHLDQGKSELQADRAAWADVKKEFPRLKKFSGARANPLFKVSTVGDLARTVAVEQKQADRTGEPVYIYQRTGPVGTSFEIHYRRPADNVRNLTLLKVLSPHSKSNPSDQAVQLYKAFHGKDPRGVVEKHVSAAIRSEYTCLGDLDYLYIEGSNGEKGTLFFAGDGVKLASSPDGTQLYLIGGKQTLDSSCLEKFTEAEGKDFYDLGEARQVQYIARKAPDFSSVKYYHKFGEEKRGSELPRVVYDSIRKQIFLMGGEYRVEQPGIIN